MRGIEAFFLKLAAIEFGFGTEIQKGQEQGLVAGVLALGLKLLDVVRMGDAPTTVVAAGMGGDQLFVVKDQELVGQDFKGQPLRGVEVRNRIAIGLEDDVAAAVDIGWLNDRAVKRKAKLW
jgi:hypothetical protein